jgi:hypothetical protein
MKRVKYGIEYSHIYTDEAFNWEHLLGVETLRGIVNTIEERGDSHVLTVLIDNYNPSNHVLDIGGFQTDLALLGAQPDYVGLEAQLVHYKDDLLQSITKPRLQNTYRKYIEQKGKVPCSFLVAIWYLGRLGVYPLHQTGVYAKTSLRPVEFSSEHIINILPRRYRKVELQALEIIESTPYRDLARNISSIFHDATPAESYVNLI